MKKSIRLLRQHIEYELWYRKTTKRRDKLPRCEDCRERVMPYAFGTGMICCCSMTSLLKGMCDEDIKRD